ncbi:uncharacterized protein LODBEIA_P50810 [Lodderomyces beijingensis]|uniref:Uncharacterized protein n=1 Tax=Lodderomyces beijingensis TaxID=1775926 RepID=A0ABP0ZRV6_9ASCO
MATVQKDLIKYILGLLDGAGDFLEKFKVESASYKTAHESPPPPPLATSSSDESSLPSSTPVKPSPKRSSIVSLSSLSITPSIGTTITSKTLTIPELRDPLPKPHNHVRFNDDVIKAHKHVSTEEHKVKRVGTYTQRVMAGTDERTGGPLLIDREPRDESKRGSAKHSRLYYWLSSRG